MADNIFSNLSSTNFVTVGDNVFLTTDSPPKFKTVPTTSVVAPPIPPQKPRQTLDFKNMARLSTLPATGYSSQNQQTGRVTIFMPHLPPEIELPRENNYDINNNLVMPDGLWIYQYTSPLEISLGFTLHAWDDLCVEGSKSLLDIAARLHTLLLPASNDPLRGNGKAPPAAGDATKAPSLDFVESSARISAEDAIKSTVQQSDTKYKYPPACSLRLLQAGAQGLGVHCVGFVKSASVVLHGPFLQTIDSANAYNLPSAATYRFTFVHNPVYTSTLQIGKFVNAFGPDVFQYFYNTAKLSALTQNTYSDVETLNDTQQGVTTSSS